MQKHQDNINLFRSLFKGREDVFAFRWEKETSRVICQRFFMTHIFSGQTK
jgi:hypothetical protein